MRTVTVREARAKFRELLDQALAGEEVVIIRRGKPIARLLPPARVPGERPFPDLSEFRASIHVHGAPLSREVVKARREARA